MSQSNAMEVDQSQSQEPRNVPRSIPIYVHGLAPRDLVLDGLHTFGDLAELLRAEGFDLENKVIVDETDTVKGEELPLHNNVPASGLAIKTQYSLTIHHQDQDWIVPVLLSSSKMTIGHIKTELINSGVPINRSQVLTWRGRPLADEERTDTLEEIVLLAQGAELPPGSTDRFRLVGLRSLKVLDVDIGDIGETELHDVRDDQPISEVLKAYQTIARRGYLHLPQVVLYIEGVTSSNSMEFLTNSLPLSSTVYSCHFPIPEDATQKTTIALKTSMFEITIKEQSEIDQVVERNKAVALAQQRAAIDGVLGIKVEVFDWWKIKQVKDQYSSQVTEGLSANDQLYLDPSTAAAGSNFNDELNEEKPLYHYRIKPESVILVKREDFTATYCYYICADCGNDVRLKPRDHVRCRECGHRIVFKRRIAKPCQYQCR